MRKCFGNCTTIISTLLFVLSTVAEPAFAAPKAKRKASAPHESLRNGRAVLAKEPKRALELCSQAAQAAALAPWAHLCAAEAYLGLGSANKAWAELRAIPSRSVASLRAKGVELQLNPINESWHEEVRAFELVIKERNLPELSPIVTYLSARRLKAEGKLFDALQQFQKVREEVSGSAIAMRARAEQETLVKSVKAKSDILPRESLRFSEYWQKEAALLVNEGQSTKAAEVLQQALEEVSSQTRSEEHFALLKAKWKITAAKKGGTKLVEKEQAAIEREPRSPLRPYLLTERALQQWKKGKYPEARALLSKVSLETSETLFLDGRLSEIQLDFRAAKNRYAKALEKGGSQAALAGQRLLWLLAKDEEWRDVYEVAGVLMRLDPPLPKLELQAVQHWGLRAAKALDKETSLADPEPFSFYYWVAKGFSLANPNNKAAEAKVTRCETKAKPILPELPEHIRSLLNWGLVDLASQELRYFFTSTDTASGKLTRARLLATYIALPASWNELRAQFEIPSAYLGPCGRELLELMYPMPFLDLYRKEAKTNALPVALALAISRTESAFNPGAVSPVGAVGLMQLMPATAKLEGLRSKNPQRDLKSANVNIRLGVRHLASLIQHLDGHWHFAIASYNAGRGAVKRWNETHPMTDAALWTELVPYKETREYVKRVLTAYWIYSWMLENP